MKLDTRIEEPISFGLPPAAKNKKGETKERNMMIIEKGVPFAIQEGLARIDNYKSLCQSVQLYKLHTNKFEVLPKLDNEWHYGPTGTGKSHTVRGQYPDAYIKGNNIWWDGYQGQSVVIIEEMGPK